MVRGFWVFLTAILQFPIHLAASFPFANAAVNATNEGEPICINSDLWSTRTFRPRDCVSAIQLFTNDISRPGGAIFEFLAAGAAPTTSLPTQQTPRKYKFKSCTMGIVLLGFFEPGELPGVPPGTLFPRTDMASYQDLWKAVERVRTRCLSKFATNQFLKSRDNNFVNPTGWNDVGTC